MENIRFIDSKRHSEWILEMDGHSKINIVGELLFRDSSFYLKETEFIKNILKRARDELLRTDTFSFVGEVPLHIDNGEKYLQVEAEMAETNLTLEISFRLIFTQIYPVLRVMQTIL